MITSRIVNNDQIVDLMRQLAFLRNEYNEMVDLTSLSGYRKQIFKQDFDTSYERLILILENYQKTKICMIEKYLTIIGSYFHRIFVGCLWRQQITSEESLYSNESGIDFIKKRNRALNILAFFKIEIDLSLPTFS